MMRSDDCLAISCDRDDGSCMMRRVFKRYSTKSNLVEISVIWRGQSTTSHCVITYLMDELLSDLDGRVFVEEAENAKST